MEKYIPLIYDFAIVLMIFIYIRKRYKAGFVSSIIYLIGNIVSFIGAWFASSYVANFIYETFLKTKISNALSETINTDTIGASITNMLNELPKILNNAILFTFGSKEQLAEKISSTASAGGEAISDVVLNTVVSPIAVYLLRAVAFLILFAIFMFIISKLAYLFKGLRHIPLVGGINSILGAGVGAVEGVVIAILITVGLGFIIVLSNGEIPFINNDLYDKSYVFGFAKQIKLINFIGK